MTWAQAEDAFLASSCTIDCFPYGTRYSAPSQPTIRLNALRVLDPAALDAARWTTTLDTHREFFNALGMALTLQLPEPVDGGAFPGRWKPVGPRFVHVVTELADFRGVSPVAVELHPVASEAQQDAFTSMLIHTRIPQPMWDFARPGIAANTRRIVEADVIHPFLVHHGASVVGQVVLTQVGRGFTMSILTVVPERRGEGLMKAIYGALAGEFNGPLYGQIIEGVSTLAFRERFPSTRRLAHTRTWQSEDDPHVRVD